MPSIQNNYFYIKSSRIHGKGVFARIQLPINTNLGPGFVKIRKTGDPDRDYARTKLGKFINHSDYPNLDIKNIRWKYYIITNRSINEDEELTLDYNTIPWEGRKGFSESWINKYVIKNSQKFKDTL